MGGRGLSDDGLSGSCSRCDFWSPLGDYAKHGLKWGHVEHSVIEPRFISVTH